jgi:uncharacterized delta-60 repeat protein
MVGLHRFVWVSVLFLGCVLAQATPASAAHASPQSATLDPQFGEGGVAHLDTEIPSGYSYTSISAFGTLPGGAGYALKTAFLDCSPIECHEGVFLARVRSDGGQDRSFGGTGVVPVAAEAQATGEALLVDSQGRPLVAVLEEGELSVRRYNAGGSADQTFGAGGKVSIDCACRNAHPIIAIGAGGGRTLLAARTGPEYPASSTVFLARLLADGSLDTSFGAGGTTRLELPGFSGPAGVAERSGGPIYLYGAGCCEGPGSSNVLRVSAKGRLDDRYDARTARVLAGLEKRYPEFLPLGRLLLLRPDGRADLFGGTPDEHGFVLRLRPDGSAQSQFGHAGIRLLPSPVLSATLDGSGGTLALGSLHGSNRGRLFHFLRSGRVDGSFGRGGQVPIPGTGTWEGLTVARQAGQRLMVFDRGVHECREGCPSTPKLIRLLLHSTGRVKAENVRARRLDWGFTHVGNTALPNRSWSDFSNGRHRIVVDGGSSSVR